MADEIPSNVFTAGFRDNYELRYEGILYSQMTSRQQEKLLELVGTYTGKQRRGHAELWLNDSITKLIYQGAVMNASFQGKRALITGGNKGIGFAIIQGLLAEGFDVILAARSLDKAKTAIEQLQSSNIRAVELDVSDDDSIDAAAQNLGQEIDSLDVLINNAGIYPDQRVTAD